MYIYGRNIIREALRANIVLHRVYYLLSPGSDRDFKRLLNTLESRKVPLISSTERSLNRVTHSAKHQGIVADIGDFPYVTLDKVLESGKRPYFFIMLDRIQDPRNLGAIMRIAAGVGATSVIKSVIDSVEVTSTVIKASAGFAFRIPVVKCNNLKVCINILKEREVWIYGTAREGKLLWDVDMKENSAMLFGNEGNGIKKSILNRCDEIIKIPMENDVESLNVSNAVAVISYELLRQRSIK